MKLELVRNILTPTFTIGRLSIDGQFQCFTLEDAVRPKKIYGQTAIWKGTYKVTITYSNRFKVMMPLVNNVPEFEGIRIHPGNTAADTEGCILVGKTMNAQTGYVGNSRDAYNELFPKLDAAVKSGDTITLEIREMKS